MRSFCLALLQVARMVLTILLFAAACLLFEVLVVGSVPQFGELQQGGHPVPSLLVGAVLRPAGLLFLYVGYDLRRKAEDLRNRELQVGLFCVLLLGVALATGAAFLLGRGTWSAGVGAALAAGGTLWLLGPLVIENARWQGEGGLPTRVVSGARASTYQRMRQREYRGEDW